VPPGPAPDLITALKMTGADIAQSELGLSGWGVTVAVIDGGIDYDHPDLGGCFGPGCRVNKGFDLVGDAFNTDFTSPSYNPTPVPDPFPDDCDGHGTHVNGIVACSGAKARPPRTSFWKRWKWCWTMAPTS
jgi:minor extracellular serine protease Vpr